MVVRWVQGRECIGYRGRPLCKLGSIGAGERTGVLACLDELTNVKGEAMNGASGGEGTSRLWQVEEIRPAAGEEGKATLTECSLCEGAVGSGHRARAATVRAATPPIGVSPRSAVEGGLGEEHAW